MTPLTLAVFMLSTAVFTAVAAPAEAPAPQEAQAEAAPPDPFTAALEELSNEDAMVRRRGAYRLGDLGNSAAVKPLLNALKDKNPFVRTGAVSSLEKLRAAQAGDQIQNLLLSDEDAQVRQQAANSLANLDAKGKDDALIRALDDKADGVRYAAARTLGSIRAQEAAKRLSEILVSGEESAGMRRAAAGALRAIRHPDSLAAMEKALSDGDVYVRREAVQAVDALGSPDSAPVLKARLGDEDPQVRVLAVSALAKRGDLSGLDAALELLTHADPRVRQQTANVVGSVGAGAGKKTIAALKHALKQEKNPGVKNSFSLAIERIEAMEKRK